MTSKTFTSGTVIDSAWLNDVNRVTYTGFSGYSVAPQTVTYGDTGVLGSFATSIAGYNQFILQNTSSATNASCNFNVSNNAATASTNYGEFGINSSTFTGTGPFSQAGYSYLASASTPLAIGTYTNQPIYFVVNSAATASATITATGINSTPIGVTTPDVGNFTSLQTTTSFSTPSLNSGYLYGNRVINGAQEIDQVNSGAAVTPAVSPVYLTDMFGAIFSQGSKLTFQQVVDAPAGLKNSTKITVASQFAPASTDFFYFQTAIEGKDVIDFQLGTSGAATFTLSHQIKGSVPGTYSVAILNSAGTRSYIGTVTVTTSYTQVKITLQGDITGTWLTDISTGMLIRWDLGSGSNYNGTAGVWAAGNTSRTSGSVTFVNQVAGSTLNITGVDCRLGSVAPTVFERRANELQLAQRYYEGSSNAPIWAFMRGSSETTPYAYVWFKQTKRAIPTLTIAWSGGTSPGSSSGIDGFQAFATGSFIGITGWNASARLF